MNDNLQQPDPTETGSQVTSNEPGRERPNRKADNRRARENEVATKEQPASTTIYISSETSPPEPSRQGTRVWKRSWFWFVLVPFFLCTIYFGLLASERYVGEAKVIVKQADNSTKSDFGIALLGAAGMSSSGQDAKLVREFVLSLDMLHYLDKTLALRTHYQSNDADIFSRLWQWQSQEGFLKYYRKHLSVEFDEISGVLTIRAQAFNPEYAQNIVKTILQYSEQFINQIGYQLANEQVKFVQKELDRAAEHLRMSKQVILEFQQQHHLFSPEQESGAKLNVVNELDAELTRSKTDLSRLRSYMNDSAGEIVALKAKIAALEQQLVIERSKLVGGDTNTFSDINAKHADLLLDLEFATDLYKSSLLSLEQARVEAYRKLKYLIVVDSPSLAEEAEFPSRLYNLVSILVILLLSYGALKIIWATIKEHRDV